MNWAAALKYANLVRIAELVEPNQEYDANTQAQLKEFGYTFLETIYGDDLVTDVDPHLGDVVTFGYLAISATGELVAVIRGTDTILEWLHDFSFLLVPSPVSKGLTDDGFTAVYKSLRIGRDKASTNVKTAVSAIPSTSVTVTGHSLGGALATLLTLDIAAKMPASYTFASPRVGDHIFVGEYKKLIKDSYRVANRMDLVTKLPTVLPLPYEHVDDHIELKPALSEVSLFVPCLHHLTTYLHLVSQQNGNDSLYPIQSGCQGVKL